MGKPLFLHIPLPKIFLRKQSFKSISLVTSAFGLELDYWGLWERPHIFRKTMFHSTCHRDQENICLPVCSPRKLWRCDCSLSKEKDARISLKRKKLNGKYISPCTVWIHRGTLSGRKNYKKERINPRKCKILKHRLNLTQKMVIWEQRYVISL